jgi:crotonobetainyl-CoA:carnitine CoA-transferase CaiB-like acyl-CoA transferase
MQAWKSHPQGRSVNAEALIRKFPVSRSAKLDWIPVHGRPLKGLRVLDLTRVLAGPVATRFLAAFGADVLRIDPPEWEEPAVIPDVTLGKRCARLDLHNATMRKKFEHLISRAHVMIHDYRPGALDNLGFDLDTRQRVSPALIDVSLNAYGWTGPWKARRGFDSLLQMSTGIADIGMRQYEKDRPVPLPVQALDHATGYLMTAAAIRGITQRLLTGEGAEIKVSLARTAKLLIDATLTNSGEPIKSSVESDFSVDIEKSAFGSMHRLRPPINITDVPMHWDRPATRLGSSTPEW